jgi:hypothetical protein
VSRHEPAHILTSRSDPPLENVLTGHRRRRTSETDRHAGSARLGHVMSLDYGAPRESRKADVSSSDLFRISESGKNGTVELGEKGLQRTLKKTMGKDDRQFIPYSSIAMVSHDRNRMGRDTVLVQVGTKSYEWKVQTDAEGFVDRLNELIT